MESLWNLLRACLSSKKEPGNESKRALWNCDISILNFYLRGSQFSLLVEMSQAVITILEWYSFKSVC